MIRIADQHYEPQRVFCIGKNYPRDATAHGGPETAHPVVFMKPGTSLVTADRPIGLRPALGPINFEGELVLVIGAPGQGLSVAAAAGHIAGLTMGLDLTRRSLQGELSAAGLPWEDAKAFDDSAAVGATGVPFDATRLVCPHYSVALNGEPRLQVDTSRMYFGPAQLVAHISLGWRLLRGDLIFTGTPRSAGVLSAGDVVTIDAEGVGSFRWDCNMAG